MGIRRVAPICLLTLLPSLALAAPPDDRPPIQRPTKVEAPPAQTEDPDGPAVGNEDQGVTGDTSDATREDAPSEAEAQPDPSDPGADTPADAGAPAPVEPAPEAAPEPTPAPEPEPEPKDLSNLLESDEPEQGASRVRVSSAGRPSRVDRNERLRNYYARIYRPEHNPSRLYFAARGAYALSGTNGGSGGGRMAFINAELGQTWNFISYAIGPTLYAGGLTFGEAGVEKFGGVLIGGGPSIGLGRLGLLGRGYFEPRIGYSFFYAPISTTRVGLADPPDAAPHGPKIQIDAGLLVHGSESRKFRHGFGASLGWQLLVHTFVGEYPIVNSFNIGVSYFFG